MKDKKILYRQDRHIYTDTIEQALLIMDRATLNYKHINNHIIKPTLPIKSD